MISCDQGKFPIKIIQGDTYRNAYTFYDKDNNVITNEHIANVYWNCDRLNYQQVLTYNVEDSSWVFYLSSTETEDVSYCKTDYDLTLYFRDEQVATEIYRSELRVLEKKNKPTADIVSGGEPFDFNNITTNVYTGIIVGAGGGTSDHSLLINRDLPNQHPMSAITGLEDALESKQPSGDYATTQELDELAEIVEGKADSGDIPTKTSELENDSDFTTKTYVDGIDSNLQGQVDDLQAEKMPLTEIDTVPTDGSTNLVESGGIYDAIDNVQQDVDDINSLISTQATPTNKLVSASEMGDAISAVEAKQIYATSSQGSFATKAQLLSATTFYNADGTVATPTENDVAYVLADESHDGKSAKYVIADITSSGIIWGFVITFSDVTFTQTQMNAINSGVTQQRVSSYDSHIANKSNPHEVTYQQLGGTKPTYTAQEVNALPISGGTMSGDINMGNNKVTIVGNPTDNTDAANKQYVDAVADSILPEVTELDDGKILQVVDGVWSDSETQETDTIDIDTVVTEDSDNLITSGAVYTALDEYQPKSITDAGGYFSTDTVEGALQEIGAELDGVLTLINNI